MKLQESDKDKIRKLFTVPVSADIVEATEFVNSNSFEFANIHHEIFSKNYLGQLLNHHSFSNDDFSCAVGIYESVVCYGTCEPIFFVLQRSVFF